MAPGLSELQRQILVVAWSYGGAVLVANIIEVIKGPRFSREMVTPAEYEGTHVSISRSVERLRRRGLVRIFKDVTRAPGTLVYLTSEGIAEAEFLRQEEAAEGSDSE
jgi:hypothetical protein